MNTISTFSFGKLVGSKVTRMIFCFLFLLIVPRTVAAMISFEDVSQASGIFRVIQTAASAWGDVNNDGWPDIWVSNHDGKEPSLYLNLKNGTFRDVADTMLVGNPRGDFHGAVWADFDNDGDQDLFITTGGGAGRGHCPNFFLVNTDGKLEDKAKPLGVDYPLGRGRTPLWFDADRDGKLDLLLMNQLRHSGEAPSAIFLQTKAGFISSNDKFGFKPLGFRSRLEELTDLLSNAIHLRPRKGPGKITPAEVFAQLADLSGDGDIDLVSYVKPMRVYSMRAIPYEEITNDIGFPTLDAVQDAAIEDFNGDGRLEIFLTRAYLTSDVAQIGPKKLTGTVKGGSVAEPKEIRFHTSGDVTFSMYMPWADPSDPENVPPPVFPGQLSPLTANGCSFRLSHSDPLVQHGVVLPDRSISVEYNNREDEWIIRISYPAINFIATAANPIDQVKTVGFTSSKGALTDVLLVKGRDRFEPYAASGISAATASRSVVAGDFDNDMDIDLYVVCTEPTRNIPNILYENDGTGHFTEVSDAGGAAGSNEGRGDRVSIGDYDRDGFLDLFVTNGAGDPPFSQGPHQLFHNRGNANHWLEIDLHGTTSNRDGIGAVVELKAGGVKQIRCQNGGIHSFSQNHQRIHFGLGNNEKADRLTIRWPSGTVQELKEIAADHIMTIVETVTAK
jgi:hypothetical protein